MNQFLCMIGWHRWAKWTDSKLVTLEVTTRSPYFTSTESERDFWCQKRTCDNCGLAQHLTEAL